MNGYRLPVTVGLLAVFAAVVYYFPWLVMFFVRCLRWLRTNRGPSLVSSLIGLACMFGGVINYVFHYGEGKEWLSQLIFVVGVIILLMINWGSPLRRVD